MLPFVKLFVKAKVTVKKDGIKKELHKTRLRACKYKNTQLLLKICFECENSVIFINLG